MCVDARALEDSVLQLEGILDGSYVSLVALQFVVDAELDRVFGIFVDLVVGISGFGEGYYGIDEIVGLQSVFE